ncbi:MAG: exodeoxyribonuclease VII small subunit [Dysgonamonadaceae bacterium]|nr:exodeoxyribonuclease VII small subunit [Dysgonamonadaceae bacterium]
MDTKKLSYTQAFNRLQEIQTQIENNQLDVDELSAVLKEAAALLKVCKDKLFTVNEETKKILQDIE